MNAPKTEVKVSSKQGGEQINVKDTHGVPLKQLYDDKKIINQRDNEGITPMKLAADVKSTECFTMFLRCLEPGEEAALFSYPYVGYTSLDILQIILKEWKIYDKVVYENFLNGTGSFQPALLGAAAKGDIEIMEFLIENSVKDKPRFDDNTALHYAAACDKMEALKLLLNSFPEMIDYTNDCGQTPAGCAVEMGNVEILRYLLDKGARLVGCNAGENLLDCAFGNFKNEGVEEAVVEIINFCNKENSETTLQELMSNSHFGPDRLMARLVKDIPNVALLILDRCIDKQTDLQNRQSGVLRRGRKEIFNFYPLKNKGKESNGNLEAINSMIKYGRDECLAHRVVQMFLLKKLASPTLKTFLRLNLLLYMIFLISLTTYVGLQTSGSYNLQSPGLIALSTICLIFCVLSIIKELLQAIFSRREYFSALNNYLEWVIYISAIIYLAKTDGNNKDHGQITAGAIAVFLAWINFIWFLKRFPRYGIYIIMTQKVFVSVIKVLPMVLLFIVAFGMAFLMLMPGDEGFKNIPNSFLTTSVMMTGEIDFRDIFLGNDNDPLRPWQRLFLVVFLVLVTIVMMNLLVGLAVDDIGGIMQRSEQSERLYQAKLVVTLEQLFYRIPKLSPPAVEDRMEYPPDREQVKGSKKLRKFVKLLKGTLKSSNNTGDNDDDDKLTCLEKKLERLTDVQEKMEEQVNQIQKTLETMANRM